MIWRLWFRFWRQIRKVATSSPALFVLLCAQHNRGGVRKVRVPVQGSCSARKIRRGKRGGARVIYYWFDARAPLYALLVYAKSTRLDMTADERKEVCALAAAIKAAYRVT